MGDSSIDDIDGPRSIAMSSIISGYVGVKLAYSIGTEAGSLLDRSPSP